MKDKYKIIRPSINPFTEKNKKLDKEEIERKLNEYDIKTNKPIISQISRLDKWKDPLGVIDAYKLVKKDIDCQLLLLYNFAKDDPEGKIMLDKVMEAKQKNNDPDIHLRIGDDPVFVNAIQSISDVILQKSLREGFALTISEALWKGTPVIGTNIGGIPLQIKHGINGYLIDLSQTDNKPNDIKQKLKEIHIQQTSNYIKILLLDKEKRDKMGLIGREIVRQKFLQIRHIKDYLKLFNELKEVQIKKRND